MVAYEGFPCGAAVKNLPAMWKTWIRSLGWEDPLKKGTATHFSILAWRILYSPWGCKESDTLSDFHFQKMREREGEVKGNR